MPVRINAEAERLRGLSVVGGDGAIGLTQQGSTMLATDMKAHVGGVATVKAMAVDAAFELCVLNQRALVERGKVTLVDTHLTPHLMARRDESVAKAIVDAIRADIKRERAISVPSIVILG